MKDIRLRFSNTSRDLVQDERCRLKNKKLDLWLGPWSLTPSYNLDLELLGPCNIEPLKQSKSSRSQMFFEIGTLKNSAIFTGKHLCWCLFLIKLRAFRPATFLKRDSNTGISCGYCKIFRWLLLKVLPQYSKVSWGACSLIFRLHVLSILIKNLHKTLHK